MDTSRLPILTPRDFAMLETILAGHVEGNDRLASAIRRKQERSRVYYDDDLPEDVVTLGSLIRYTINDRPSRECRLVEPQHYVPGQGCQSLASLRGVAMLGLRVGDRVGVDLGTRVETLDVVEVLYQPQTAAKASRKTRSLEMHWRRPEPVIPKPTSKPRFEPDPGPSAA